MHVPPQAPPVSHAPYAICNRERMSVCLLREALWQREAVTMLSTRRYRIDAGDVVHVVTLMIDARMVESVPRGTEEEAFQDVLAQLSW
jgi:hypothetical protein